MPFLHITCLPDLLRGEPIYPEGLFDLVREPIHQGCGIDIMPPSGKQIHGLIDGFDLMHFRTLAGVDIDNERGGQWAARYYSLPIEALDYLFAHWPAQSLLLSMEIPPWLAQACTERGITFLDIRSSPLRFGRDHYMALRCSDASLFGRISAQAVTEDEIRLETATLAANVRMHKRRLLEARNYPFQSLDGSLVYVGQAPYDASLLAPDGYSLRCADFSDQLRILSSGRRILYKGHPFAPDFANAEHAELERITGRPVEICHQNAYQILSTHDDVELVGISSGLLQEAAWFGKKAHVLFQPFVPLAKKGEFSASVYQQVHFKTLLAPAFWHQILTPQRPAPRLSALPDVAHNHGRETLDLWWDYSKVMIWERSLHVESFERSGGGLLRQRIEKLEQNARTYSANYIQGHDFSLHSGERQVATRYKDIRADHRYRYEWVDARLPEGGFGLDTFCGNGYGTWQLSKRRHVWGIDGSVEAVQLAQQHYRTPQAFFSQAYYPFSLPKERFDFAVSLESVEHMEDGERFFAALAQSLKPGGLLCFSTPCEEKLPHTKFSDHFHFHYKHYSLEETRNLALSHGLEILSWAGQDVYAFLPNGELTLLTDERAMQLKEKTIGQFLIFLCRKACSV